MGQEGICADCAWRMEMEVDRELEERAFREKKYDESGLADLDSWLR